MSICATRKRVVGVGATLVILVALSLATPAEAHDPIFLTDEQTSPDTGPYLPDGTISFAMYGSLLAPGETRGFEFDLRDGDELYLSLLIPDLEPETSLADDDLPVMTLIDPDGAERPISATMRSPFADPFSGTNYITLFETQEPAAGGRYQVVVTGASPTRFVVAVGTKEEFFTPTERSVDRPTSFPGIAAPLNAWYTTPADGSEPVNAASGDDVDVDVELIEEELDNLEEQEAQAASATTEAAGESDGEPDQAAVAEVEADGDGGGGAATWVAPVVIAVVVVAGGGFYLRRRLAA